MEKKSSKKKVLWGLGILFILLVIIVIIHFVIGYKNDQIESKKKIDSVITSYNNFKTHIDSFNKDIKDIVAKATTRKPLEEQMKELEFELALYRGEFPEQMLKEFYDPFLLDLKKAEGNMERVKIAEEVSDVICDLCGKNMVVKQGRFGKFLACPGYPECKNKC